MVVYMVLILVYLSLFGIFMFGIRNLDIKFVVESIKFEMFIDILYVLLESVDGISEIDKVIFS